MSPILFFIFFFICTGVGKIFLQIKSAAVAFIDIIRKMRRIYWTSFCGKIMRITVPIQNNILLVINLSFIETRQLSFHSVALI